LELGILEDYLICKNLNALLHCWSEDWNTKKNGFLRNVFCCEMEIT
jgi:hypothetical protein